MTLAQKLVLYALAVALLPLAATGFTLVRQGEAALRERIMAHQRTAASSVAATIAQSIDEIGERATTAMTMVDPLTLGPRGRQGLLRLLHRQSDAVAATVLLDGDAKLLTSPVVAGESELDGAGSGDTKVLATPASGPTLRLLAHAPSLAAFAGKTLVVLASPAYFDEQGPAHIALAASCCADTAGRPQAVAAIELTLQSAILKTGGIDVGPEARLFVVDAQGRVIAHPSMAVGRSLAGHAAVAAHLRARAAGSARFRDGDAMWVASSAPVGDLGWAVVVEQPERLAFAQAAQMRQRMLLWMAVTTALVLGSGLAFAGRLRTRLARLMAGARAYGSGKLEERVPAEIRDEIGELGGTMNLMASELAQSLAELEQWNRTLEEKVEQRTRELQQAQAYLLTQSKLAAIGQLGAGVAHEVNNPLASILGYAQLLMRKHSADDSERSALKKIEEAAQRCKAITTKLLRFSQRGQLGRAPMEMNGVLEEVLEMMVTSLRHGGVRVERALGAGLPQITADASQIALVLINLVSNAINAMPQGGVLSLSTATHGDGVRVTVSDTGHGIEPEHLPRLFEPFFTTKRVWAGVGLGLAVAYRIVADHGGRIEVDSKVGEGSRFIVTLPRVPPPGRDETLAAPPASSPALVT